MRRKRNWETNTVRLRPLYSDRFVPVSMIEVFQQGTMDNDMVQIILSTTLEVKRTASTIKRLKQAALNWTEPTDDTIILQEGLKQYEHNKAKKDHKTRQQVNCSNLCEGSATEKQKGQCGARRGAMDLPSPSSSSPSCTSCKKNACISVGLFRFGMGACAPPPLPPPPPRWLCPAMRRSEIETVCCFFWKISTCLATQMLAIQSFHFPRQNLLQNATLKYEEDWKVKVIPAAI